MNVTRITQLFSVQGGASVAQSNRTDSAETVDKEAQAKTKANDASSEAVKVSASSDPALREAKVASIKAAIQNNSYNYNRPGVATAVYRDLL